MNQDDLKNLAEETAKYYEKGVIPTSVEIEEYSKLFSLYQKTIARKDDLETEVISLRSLVKEQAIFRKLLEEYMVPGGLADNSYLDWVKRVESALK